MQNIVLLEVSNNNIHAWMNVNSNNVHTGLRSQELINPNLLAQPHENVTHVYAMLK